MVREGNALLPYLLLEILRAAKQALRWYIKFMYVQLDVCFKKNPYVIEVGLYEHVHIGSITEACICSPM